MNDAPHIEINQTEALLQARVDLAALHRIAWQWGWSEAVVNHMTVMAPGFRDAFLLIPYGLHWSEVRASDFLVVNFDGKVLSGEGRAEISAVALHAPIHRRAPHARCVLHTHQPNVSSLTALRDQTLLMAHQDAILFHDAVAYLDAYEDLPLDMSAGDLCADALGDKLVLLMKNHGPMVVGETIAKTFQTLYYLDRVVNVQMRAYSTGQPVQTIADDIARKDGAFFREHYLTEEAAMHFAAIKRILDRRGEDYAR
jgi:ribulose-5-phosphate 4-epimerase/fuculose-1-phosphate aldolase